MAIQTAQLFAIVSLVVLCGAIPSTPVQDATKTSQAAPNPISMASPESSVIGMSPRLAQMNMMEGSIDQIIADAMKNTMIQGGGVPMNTMGGIPTSAMNTANTQSFGNAPRMPSMPRLPMNMMSMMNPLSMFSGGSGSPFGMMRPMMMMNMMENLFEMIGF